MAYFEELSIEEKVEATIDYFHDKDKKRARGIEEADQFLKSKKRRGPRMQIKKTS